MSCPRRVDKRHAEGVRDYSTPAALARRLFGELLNAPPESAPAEPADAIAAMSADELVRLARGMSAPELE
ncbi:hypothetical protein GFY24_36525 [Nocardia sp. SYP-A9097]|uniref:hypothetical protein n=1 Tax=Nocardia sp. SYP-A9097 TaxID=2663237 RepID=UPI00129A9B5D|nr:hypothetical protein [Nocardia sp. SYP-A9097]MRH92865.1 hypothetical protein [Nocardia sp. SYP-A9097]